MSIKPVKVWPGKPYPLGATWDGAGVNFALYSQNASAVELCIFDDDGEEINRIRFTEHTDLTWHLYPSMPVRDSATATGSTGPRPSIRHRFNPNKLLLDPMSAIDGTIRWDDSLLATGSGTAGQTSFDEQDSAPFSPDVVVDPASLQVMI